MIEFLNNLKINPIYITTISTLLGVMITLYFTNKREKNKILIDYKFKEHNELKEFYILLLASIDKSKRIINKGQSLINLIDEMSIISAKTYIIGSPELNKQVLKISSLLYNWSAELDNKQMNLSSFNPGPMEVVRCNSDTAKAIEIDLNRAIGLLIELIKDELAEITKNIK